MLKAAYAQGVDAAFEKFALSPAFKQKAMGAALERRGLAPVADVPVTSEALHAARTGRPGPQTAAAANGVIGGNAGAGGVDAAKMQLPPSHLVNEGVATAAPGAMNAVKRFGYGQMAHGSNLLHGLGNIGSEPGRAAALNSLKGLAPSLAGLGGAYMLTRGHGDDQQQQQPRMF